MKRYPREVALARLRREVAKARRSTAICGKCLEPLNLQELTTAHRAGVSYVHGCGRKFPPYVKVMR